MKLLSTASALKGEVVVHNFDDGSYALFMMKNNYWLFKTRDGKHLSNVHHSRKIYQMKQAIASGV